MSIPTNNYKKSSGQNVATFRGHTGEVVTNQFNKDGTTVITGSFDSTIKLWDTRTCRYILRWSDSAVSDYLPYIILYSCIATLSGHTAELSACRYNFSCNMIASSSLDSTAKLWDVRSTDSCHHTVTGHTDEVITFKTEKSVNFRIVIIICSCSM